MKDPVVCGEYGFTVCHEGVFCAKNLSETDKNSKMHFIDECYSKRWGEPITEVFKRAEGPTI